MIPLFMGYANDAPPGVGTSYVAHLIALIIGYKPKPRH
jgi:hypothetical protein